MELDEAPCGLHSLLGYVCVHISSPSFPGHLHKPSLLPLKMAPQTSQAGRCFTPILRGVRYWKICSRDSSETFHFRKMFSGSTTQVDAARRNETGLCFVKHVCSFEASQTRHSACMKEAYSGGTEAERKQIYPLEGDKFQCVVARIVVDVCSE